MKQITSNDELIPGQWYWARSKGGQKLQNGDIAEPGEFAAHMVEGGDGRPKSICSGMWCDPKNDQALGHYEIHGPILPPNVELKGCRKAVPSNAGLGVSDKGD